MRRLQVLSASGLIPPVYAVLLPLLPIATVYAANVNAVPFADFIWSAAALLSAYHVIRIAAIALTRRPLHVDIVLGAAVPIGTSFSMMLPSQLKVIGAVVMLGVVIFLAAKCQERRANLHKALVVAGIVLCAIPLSLMALRMDTDRRQDIISLTENVMRDLPQPAAASEQQKPDIYYFIFDRYARADQLQRVYGHDNSDFLDGLRQRGFAVADKAYSNYQRTAHSLASSLNLDYLTALDMPASDAADDWVPIYSMLGDFRLQRFLRSQGYTFHQFGSWWQPTRVNAHADVSHTYRAWPALLRLAYQNSILPHTAKLTSLDLGDQLRLQCKRAKWKFTEIANMKKASSQPAFVFAHFLVPHPPFVIKETGACMDVEEARARTRSQNYIGQLTWTNAQILAMVDALLARPGPKPIIVLQADEGPWPERFAADEVTRVGSDVTNADWVNTSADELREKMAILNAIYLPDGRRGMIAADATPVNTFRMILREYFGVPIKDLPVRHYIYKDTQHLYDFVDVTEKLTSQDVAVQE